MRELEGKVAAGSRTAILSPDQQQYWTGDRWAPALLSPDKKAVWTGTEWLPVATPAGMAPQRLPAHGSISPSLLAYASCSAPTLALWFVGLQMAEPIKSLLTGAAAVPLLYIPAAHDALKGGHVSFLSPLRAWRSFVGKLRFGSWVMSGVLFGAALSILILALIRLPVVGWLSLLLLPWLVGGVIAVRSGGRGVRVAVTMGCVSAVLLAGILTTHLVTSPLASAAPHPSGIALAPSASPSGPPVSGARGAGSGSEASVPDVTTALAVVLAVAVGWALLAILGYLLARLVRWGGPKVASFHPTKGT